MINHYVLLFRFLPLVTAMKSILLIDILTMPTVLLVLRNGHVSERTMQSTINSGIHDQVPSLVVEGFESTCSTQYMNWCQVYLSKICKSQ